MNVIIICILVLVEFNYQCKKCINTMTYVNDVKNVDIVTEMHTVANVVILE